MEYKKKKVVHLRGVYNDYNFGDDLLLISNLEFLKQVIKEDSVIYLKKGNESLSKLNYVTSFKHKYAIEISTLFQNLNQRLKKISLPKIFRLAILSIYFLLLISGLLINRFTKKTIFYKEMSNFVKKLDVVHYIGGGYFADKWPLIIMYELTTIFLYRIINPKLKIIGTGLGLGPFKYRLSLFFARIFFSKFDFISVREEKSFKLLKKFNLNNIKLLGDDVLLMNDFITHIRGSEENKVFALNLKDFSDHNHALILSKVNEIIIELLNKDIKVQFYSFGHFPGPDDESILKKLNQQTLQHIEILNPYNVGYYPFLKSLSSVKYGVGFAYHFAILTSLLNLPTLNVYSGGYYKQKIMGAMELMCNANSVLSINEFSKLDASHFSQDLENDNLQHEKNKTLSEKMIKEYSSVYMKL